MAWRLLNFLKVFWISVFTPLQPVAYALDKVLFKWALFYIKIGTLFADTGLLYQIGLEQTTGLLGLDYRQHCYNCLSPALSVVFVIDDAGSVSGQLQQYKRLSDTVSPLSTKLEFPRLHSTTSCLLLGTKVFFLFFVQSQWTIVKKDYMEECGTSISEAFLSNN